MKRLTADGSFKGMFNRLWEYTVRREKAAKAAKRRRKEEIEDGEFIVSKKELADATLISESVLKHLCSSADETMRTSRDNVIALCLAMKLPPDYTERLLASAGYSLGYGKRDKIIREHIEKRTGGIQSLSCDLIAAGERDLSVSE